MARASPSAQIQSILLFDLCAPQLCSMGLLINTLAMHLYM